jgi:hypothetical protein
MPVLLLLDCPTHAETHCKIPYEPKMIEVDAMRKLLRSRLLNFYLPVAHLTERTLPQPLGPAAEERYAARHRTLII